MRRRAQLWLLLVAAVAVGCATTSAPAAVPPPQALALPSPPTAAPARAPEHPGLRFRVVPPDTLVLVDGQDRGTAAEVGEGSGLLELGPGIHRISLKRAGYQTWRGEVTVGDEVELLEVSLEKKP